MKNNQTYRSILPLILAFFVVQTTFAQSHKGLKAKGLKTHKRYTEAEVKAEEQFIAADALFILEKYEESVIKFKEFLKDFPKNAMAHFQLGRAYNKLHETQKATSSLKKAIELDGQNRWFLVQLAEVYESNGQADLAAAIMVDLTKVEPKKHFAYKKAAFYYLLAQKPNKALQILAQGEKTIGFDTELSYRKYVIYLAQGDTQKGIEALQQILKYHPKDTEYRITLAETYQANNKPSLAEKEYRHVLEYDPYNSEALIGLQRRKVSLGDSDREGLAQMVANPDIGIDLKIVELVPILQKATPQSSEADKKSWGELVEKLMAVHPNHAKASSVAGDMYYAIGQNELALKAYQKTLEKEKSVYPVWQQVLELQFTKKQYKAVVQTATQALDYFPNKSKIVIFLAEAQNRNGNLKKALSNYQQASIMSGRNRHQKRFILARLSELYLTEGKMDKAKKYLEKAEKLNDINDPHIEHLKKEIKEQKRIPYSGKWLSIFPFGVLLMD